MPTTCFISVFAVLCVTNTIICVDWTVNCSTSCKCKWMSGKKSALCDALSLTQIPSNLSTEIQVLMLNENNLQTLNREEFTTLGLINLQKIYLKKSNIKYLHRETFKNLKILVELDLSENLIEQLDKQTFSGNDRLRILYLYSNPIKILIADQFPVLPYLRTIDLHNCEIVSVEETSFSNVDLLEYLNLKQNALQSLPGNVFTHMKNLKTLHIDDNPWNCDCKLKKFRNWYVKNNLNRISLQCKSPFSLIDQQWENIHEDAFGCAPTLKILKEDIHSSDLESNITFKCYTTGDPRPTISWQLDGKEIENENVVIDNDETPQVSSVSVDQQHPNGKLWSNLSIYNITNLNAGFYTCFARNDLGLASQNITLVLPEVVDHVLIKNSDTFWYFGLIMGIFGTIIGFMLISFVFCVCRKITARRRTKKNIKGSVSFNDQEKKLLDLSITTTNDRDRDYGEILNTPSSTSATNKTDSSIIALEPVQITIENFHHPHNLQHHLQHHRRMGDEFPLNISLFPPPPPEFCTSTAQSSLMTASGTTPSSTNGQLYQQNTNHHLRHNHHQQQHLPLTANKPPFGNIFISVSVTQDPLENDLNMYPDLLNIVPNRMKNSSTATNLSLASSSLCSSPPPPNIPTSQIVPINIESYATLPRNKLLNSSPGSKAPVSILKQTKKNYDKKAKEGGECLRRSGSSSDISSKCVSCNLKNDNMGLRVTASGTGKSVLSIPDEELEEDDDGRHMDEMDSPSHDHQSMMEQADLGHHLTSASYHHQQEQLSPPPPPKSQAPSADLLMPNDFVSL